MQARKRSKTTIRYVLVTDELQYIPFLSPQKFDNAVIEFVKRCPIDLLQLWEPLRFYEMYNQYSWLSGVHFQIFYTKNIGMLIQEMLRSNIVTMLFLDSGNPEHHKAYFKIKTVSNLAYFNFRNENGNDFKDSSICRTAFDFVSRLIANQQKIAKKLKFPDLKLNVAVEIGSRNFNQLSHFSPSLSNYHLINQITGNFCSINLDLDEKSAEEERDKAQLGKNSFARQIKRNNFFKNLMSEHGCKNYPCRPNLNTRLWSWSFRLTILI